jgi:YfiH family protein
MRDWRWQHGDAHALFTSREHGNVGLHVGDDPAVVGANRARIAQLAGLTPERVAGTTQVHGTDVWMDLRFGGDTSVARDVQWDAHEPLTRADALVSNRRGIGLAVGVADCMPIAIAWGDAFAAVHAGWRGLVGGVLERVLPVLRQAAGSSVALADVEPRAVIGPSLGPCCFEVGEEVAEVVPASSIVRRPDAPKPFLDARAEAVRRLALLGVETDVVDVCTRDDDACFSHRGDGGTTGRQALLVWRA